ncbi:DUF1549 domain-containing protein [Bremerella cremea]|uniref:DUF1549 domain-containing protein n=1 Tax=Bremerella cremea TaxID=1031537 RepID=UPI0031EC37EA
MARTTLLGSVLWLCCISMAMAEAPSAPQLANRIDQLLHEFQQDEKVVPSQQSSDPEYLRRVYLDLGGRIPTVAEAREFLKDESPDKRQQLAHKLVRSGTHARQMATFWRRTWIPQTDTQEFRDLTDEFETWLTLQFANDAPYDQVVRKMLTVNIPDAEMEAHTGASAAMGTPESFLTASQRLPSNLAANTTRAFLGLNLDCAQCHDHPFSRWTQEQFWETAAFFARPKAGDDVTAEKFEIELPESTVTVSATLFTGDEVPWPEAMTQDSGRKALSDWVTGPGNPYFAKNAVNRLWAHYFGVGLVEPLDDLSEDNPALQPEILDELADAFVESGYDLKLLSEAIVLTEAYQRTSRVSAGEEREVDLKSYARMPVRGMSGEQLYQSIRTAAGMKAVRDDIDPTRGLDDGSRFVSSFFVEDAAHAERSILQALALMNGDTTAEVIDTEQSPMLRVLADAPFLSTSQKIDTLFLATLGRKPDAEEVELFTTHLKESEDRSEALSNLMWVLINSAEFNTNH